MNKPDNNQPQATGSLPGAGSGGGSTALKVVVIVLAVIGGLALLGFAGMTMMHFGMMSRMGF
jgi:hypothetical protein